MSISDEEDNFIRENQKLLERNRERWDAYREEQRRLSSRKPHWMICPKCGSELVEEAILKVMVDRCVGCEGIFLDRGELSTLFEAREQRGFFTRLKKSFDN